MQNSAIIPRSNNFNRSERRRVFLAGSPISVFKEVIIENLKKKLLSHPHINYVGGIPVTSYSQVCPILFVGSQKSTKTDFIDARNNCSLCIFILI